MKEQILNFVRERRRVSFVELERLLGDRMSGDYDIVLGSENENIILWVGVSEQFAETFNDMVKTGAVRLKPTSLFVYLVDGKALTLPLVKGRYRYKQPHWLPVVLDVPERNGRENRNRPCLPTGRGERPVRVR